MEDEEVFIDQVKLWQRVRDYKEDCGVTYRFLANELEINPSSLYNFTRGMRPLRLSYAMKLDEYLEDRGY